MGSGEVPPTKKIPNCAPPHRLWLRQKQENLDDCNPELHSVEAITPVATSYHLSVKFMSVLKVTRGRQTKGPLFRESVFRRDRPSTRSSI